MEIRLVRLSEAARLPEYASAGAAGADLFALVPDGIVLEPGMRATVPTGLALAIPQGYEAQVRPRSGLAAKHGVTVLNAPGTIDSDYRGELKILLVNLGDQPFEIRDGDRIAQLVVAPVSRARFVVGPELGGTERGSGGFGSTGR
ncbi:MAG: deoxyuridine 5'-triphosphate nucleotidohydrolase [Treponema sp. GWB1_62_6]|nr:MAG: deoxyuridine 5'-triphosphate nucleotidohydrolase [Treponema sp. GWC1_61_84]OHE69213.1 MAG: deoxyuridine 5'-triphosphate nucleotidohydrolase [Treponema sp. GWB1_62_6]OHE69401.1 MAG: deoxyuridine 5'-triphosphate nucleotidohydrolase [Treponema sp. RIFOXYC1_FULL_61_9]